MAIYAYPKMSLDIIHFLLFKKRRLMNNKNLSLQFNIMNYLTLFTAIMENASVLILSMITSNEVYKVHAFFFLLFLIFGYIHYFLYEFKTKIIQIGAIYILTKL